MPKGAVTASCAIHEENTHTGTPPALSLRCLISKVTNQSLWEDFRANLVFADQKNASLGQSLTVSTKPGWILAEVICCC